MPTKKFRLATCVCKRGTRRQRGASTRKPPEPTNQTPEEVLEAFLTSRDPSLFEYICLKRLGRLDEAAARLAHFENSFPTARKDGRDRVALRRLRDLYAIEVFLSLNAVDEAEAWCRRGLAGVLSNDVRLDRTLVLGQVLLLRGKEVDYARLMTETALPLLLVERRLEQDSFVAELLGLLPLTQAEFLARLPEGEVQNLRSVCIALKPGTAAISEVWLGVFEEAACRRLGMSVAADSVHERQVTNPIWWEVFGPGGPEAFLADVERIRGGLPGLLGWLSARCVENQLNHRDTEAQRKPNANAFPLCASVSLWFNWFFTPHASRFTLSVEVNILPGQGRIEEVAVARHRHQVGPPGGAVAEAGEGAVQQGPPARCIQQPGVAGEGHELCFGLSWHEG